MGQELGLYTDKEGKFFAKIIANEIPVKGIAKAGMKLLLPILVNGADNKFGEKVPDPWKGYCRELFSKTYLALQDGILTDKEIDEIVSISVRIINENIDLPLLSEEDEAIAFMFMMKSFASLLKKAVKKED